MESYTNEREQLDAVRRFFSGYGPLLIIGIVAGIIALIGWNYWRNHQNTLRMETASSWQQASKALLTDKANGVAALEDFASNTKNHYGALASLQLSVYFVENNDFTKAEQQLKQSISQIKESNLLSLVNLQLARIQLQQKKPDEALATLNAVTEGAWNAMAQMIRGDAMYSKGNIQGAQDAYNDGLRFSPSEELTELLRMKLNNLPSPS